LPELLPFGMEKCQCSSTTSYIPDPTEGICYPYTTGNDTCDAGWELMASATTDNRTCSPCEVGTYRTPGWPPYCTPWSQCPGMLGLDSVCKLANIQHATRWSMYNHRANCYERPPV
jgi:hypothetical protein